MKLKVRNKLIIGFMPLLIVIFLFSLAGIKTFIAIHQNISDLQQKITPTAMSMLELKSVLLSLETEIKARDIDQKKTEEQIGQIQNLLRNHLATEDSSDDPNKQIAQDIRLRAMRVMKYARYLRNTTKKSWMEPAEVDKIMNNIYQERIALSNILDEHIALHLKDLTSTEQAISKQYQTGIYIIQAAVALLLLLTTAMIIYLAKTILTPVALLREGVRQIGNGVLDYNLALNTGDEFEEFAVEFKTMARKLKDSYQDLDHKVLTRTSELTQANTELHKAESQIHALTKELITAQEIERKKISLDLHDNVAQELSALKIMSETLFASEPPPDLKQIQGRMSDWANVLKRCIGTVRELTYDLRPPGLEQMGIKNSLADYCREFSKKTGIQLSFNSAGMDSLSLSLDYEVAINLYRLVQEALNNIKKHADASTAQIRLLASGPQIILQIEDNGRGFDPEAIQTKVVKEKRLGLLGMKERVRILRGTIEISSRPDEGTKIFIEVPWRNEHAEH